jgi:hypothetical protein
MSLSVLLVFVTPWEWAAAGGYAAGMSSLCARLWVGTLRGFSGCMNRRWNWAAQRRHTEKKTEGNRRRNETLHALMLASAPRSLTGSCLPLSARSAYGLFVFLHPYAMDALWIFLQQKERDAASTTAL